MGVNIREEFESIYAKVFPAHRFDRDSETGRYINPVAEGAWNFHKAAHECEPMGHGELHETMTDDFKAAWKNGLPLDSMEAKWAFVGWQAARESEGGEAAAEIVNKPWPKGVVPVPKTGRWYAVHLLDDDGDIPHGTQLYTHPPKQQSGVLDQLLESLAQKAEDSDITFEAVHDNRCDPISRFDVDIEERVADWIRAQKGIALSTPQLDKWIACSERLPTEADEDPWGNITLIQKNIHPCRPMLIKAVDLCLYIEQNTVSAFNCLWMPTGLTRPAPPEQESE